VFGESPENLIIHAPGARYVLTISLLDAGGVLLSRKRRRLELAVLFGRRNRQILADFSGQEVIDLSMPRNGGCEVVSGVFLYRVPGAFPE
jgi:hypothetical protein